MPVQNVAICYICTETIVICIVLLFVYSLTVPKLTAQSVLFFNLISYVIAFWLIISLILFKLCMYISIVIFVDLSLISLLLVVENIGIGNLVARKYRFCRRGNKFGGNPANLEEKSFNNGFRGRANISSSSDCYLPVPTRQLISYTYVCSIFLDAELLKLWIPSYE